MPSQDPFSMLYDTFHILFEDVKSFCTNLIRVFQAADSTIDDFFDKLMVHIILV